MAEQFELKKYAKEILWPAKLTKRKKWCFVYNWWTMKCLVWFSTENRSLIGVSDRLFNLSASESVSVTQKYQLDLLFTRYAALKVSSVLNVYFYSYAWVTCPSSHWFNLSARFAVIVFEIKTFEGILYWLEQRVWTLQHVMGRSSKAGKESRQLYFRTDSGTALCALRPENVHVCCCGQPFLYTNIHMAHYKH